MQIHPEWTNQPSDAAALDKGRMRLDKNEEVIFNKGDINQWDFSLITSALRFSKICAIEIRKKPGCDTVLQELKKTRNKLLGHPCKNCRNKVSVRYMFDKCVAVSVWMILCYLRIKYNFNF